MKLSGMARENRSGAASGKTTAVPYVRRRCRLLAYGAVLLAQVTAVSAMDRSICAPDSGVTLHPDGQLNSCVAREPVTVKDVKCNSYSLISFHENGQLRHCVLRENYSYGPIVCNQPATISFYSSGQLETCDLAKPVQIEGVDCNQGETISFFENGTLRSCGRPL
ncbi:hypothetical protein [Geobacter sp. SVR]|uniref:hypothetical protein n=1 Tax=Geobacter sp. SVR TaxID=2495594 RepID=UPI00143F03D3|nr:hypothetical protein [Geobacter sp. SVR]BCS54815.1 hypothetical protein GSVR_31230 [Geobacter sp. SVR]GCF86377.1 hypothetical protein GSbR_29770 [Geobacter sp. SVR]